MTTRAPSRTPRRRRHTALLVTIGIVVALVAVAVGGEFYARDRVGSCVATAMGQEVDGDVDVSLGATPLLLTPITGTVSSISVNSDSINLAGPGEASMRGLQLRSTIHDISLPEGDGTGTVGSSEASVSWANDDMLASLQTLPFGMLISGVTTDPATGTIDVAVAGGLGSMSLTPRIEGGVVTMQASDITAFGIGLPTGGAQQIIDLLTRNLAEYPLQMQPTSVDVTDQGLQVKLQGGPAPLTTADGPKVDCSII
ncbi:DUF2993 domain-containing protein [Tomitella fengzijianii]|uniref:DUF2993 domain-containing protein n=1 Tax=Tomitella fengzijianii TaxID=2597660 RepID=A0A516X5E6_9ACTN|nr:DUF2993 domain-containing protein [Tomitella fengzijianii]QDQ98270.1 DUF2993 domain-containing protein [Tomitella fengzijianii]